MSRTRVMGGKKKKIEQGISFLPQSVLSTDQLRHFSLGGVVPALSDAPYMPLFCQRISCFHSNDSHAPTLSTSR